MDFYYSLNDITTESTISRSRFITKAYHVDNEDDALNILNQLVNNYSDSTHICYAYVADIYGVCARFSDDGEPSGTAGKPILDAILKNELKQILIAVVRYFGGIKLGSGGLTRAYGGCASQIIEKSDKTKYVLSDVFTIYTDFKIANTLKNYILEIGKIFNINYTDNVTIVAAVPSKSNFNAKAFDISKGHINIKKIKTDYIVYD